MTTATWGVLVGMMFIVTVSHYRYRQVLVRK